MRVKSSALVHEFISALVHEFGIIRQSRILLRPPSGRNLECKSAARLFHAKARRREGWRASVPTSRLPLRGRIVSGSLAERREGRASLVRGQADACPILLRKPDDKRRQTVAPRMRGDATRGCASLAPGYGAFGPLGRSCVKIPVPLSKNAVCSQTNSCTNELMN